jgi:hypothetical protein
MLLRFEVSNHRSILDTAELSMIAVDKDRASTWKFEKFDEQVLSVAGIYGPNASGKSNVIDALAWLSRAVRMSLLTWDEFIPREPFKFGIGPANSSIFEIEMIISDVRHTYRVELNDKEVLFESLYSYPERRRRVLFEREGITTKFRRGISGLSGTRELITPRTLALSAAMHFEVPDLREFARTLASIRSFGSLGRMTQRGQFGTFGLSREIWFEDRQPKLFKDDDPESDSSRNSALALLRFADLGIDSVQITEEPDEDGGQTSGSQRHGPRHLLRLVHRAATQDLPFDFLDESMGTRTWFNLIGPTLRALKNGQILLLDEIDASLHPRLSVRLIELFQDRQTNREGAQLIFTSHDTSLLNHLNRDEVWLTEKSASGATTLIALAEFGSDKVRSSVNLERAYLQGRFGAVPELDQLELQRAMGFGRSDS